LDLNKQFKNHATDLFATMKNDPNLNCRHRLGGLTFQVGEDVPGLQAADLLAYQTYKFGKMRIQRGQAMHPDEIPNLLRKLISKRRKTERFPFLDKEGLNVTLSNFPTHLRSPGWHPVTLKSKR